MTMRRTQGLVLLCSLLISAGVPSLGRNVLRDLEGEGNHDFQIGDEIELWANKVGPFANPRRVFLRDGRLGRTFAVVIGRPRRRSRKACLHDNAATMRRRPDGTADVVCPMLLCCSSRPCCGSMRRIVPFIAESVPLPASACNPGSNRRCLLYCMLLNEQMP